MSKDLNMNKTSRKNFPIELLFLFVLKLFLSMNIIKRVLQNEGNTDKATISANVVFEKCQRILLNAKTKPKARYWKFVNAFLFYYEQYNIKLNKLKMLYC